MNFEDRIRNHMSEQGELINISPEGPDAAAARQGRRARNRMGTGAVAVILAAIGGFGLWSVAVNDEPVATQVTSVGRDAAERSTEDSGESSTADTTGDSADVSAGDTQTVQVGAPLEAVTMNSEGAPGYGSEMRASGGAYYVLSTAPGSVIDPEAPYNDAFYRPNTIYRFDEGSGWSNTEITDRWVSDFVPDGDVLYVLSTGRTDGSIDPTVGVSNDRGASWDWTSVDGFTDAATTDENGLSHTTLRLLPIEGRQFVLAQLIGYADWEEGIQLAKDAGLEISGRRDVVNVNQNGISYNIAYQDDPQAACWDIESRYYEIEEDLYQELVPEPSDEVDWNAISKQIQEAMAERGKPLEAELIAAGCDNTIACSQVQQAYYSIGQHLYPMEEPDALFDWETIEKEIRELQAQQAPEFEARLLEAGCDNFIACDRISTDIAVAYSTEQDALSESYDNYENLTEEERIALSVREQALWQRIEAETQPALEAAGCPNYYGEEGFAGDYPELDQDVVTITWSELGVTVPESWGGSSSYYELVGGSAAELAFPFGDELVVDVRSDTSGLQVVSVPQASFYGEFAEPPTGPVGTIWTTADGVTWQAGDTTESPYGGHYGGPGPVQVGDTRLRIQWLSEADFEEPAAAEMPDIPADAEILFDEEAGLPYFIDPDGNSIPIPAPRMVGQEQLERSIAGGPWEPVSYADLGVDVAPRMQANRVIASPIGVFVIANDYGEHGPGGMSSAIMYSSDGVNWSSHVLDTFDVNAIVGPDSVLFVGHPAYGVEEGETPRLPTTLLIRPAN